MPDIPDDLSQYREEFFCDMKDIIVEIGEGIALAQQKIDESAIKSYEKILENKEFKEYGLTPTWLTIPEAQFHLKMNYTVTQKKQSSGDTSTNSIRRLLISPMNARYNNYFNLTESVHSEMKLKIVPIPSPSCVSEAVIVPDVIGKTYKEAKKIIAESGLLIQVAEEVADNKKVTSQLPEPGEEVRFKEKIFLKFD